MYSLLVHAAVTAGGALLVVHLLTPGQLRAERNFNSFILDTSVKPGQVAAGGRKARTRPPDPLGVAQQTNHVSRAARGPPA